MPNAMKIRRQTVEHPVGILKAWMGATHFLTRTFAIVMTEMSRQVPAYTKKRMIQISDLGPLVAAMPEARHFDLQSCSARTPEGLQDLRSHTASVGSGTSASGSPMPGCASLRWLESGTSTSNR